MIANILSAISTELAYLVPPQLTRPIHPLTSTSLETVSRRVRNALIASALLMSTAQPSSAVDGFPTPTPTATCPSLWSHGASFPADGVVSAVGVFFPPNERFYSLGGRPSNMAGDEFTNPFEYNPAVNTWMTKTAVYPDNKVNNMACGVLNLDGTDQIYCVGGNASQVSGATHRVFSYNPVTDTITTLTTADDWPIAGSILPGGFAVAGNKLYIIGGNAFGATREVWQFDPNAAEGSRWLARSPLPVGRGWGVPAATIDGVIYTAGGGYYDELYHRTFGSTDSFKYDPVTDNWTSIASIPRRTWLTRAVVIENQMWVLGGGTFYVSPTNEVNIYDPARNTWSTAPKFRTSRRLFPTDGDGHSRIWLTGGGTGFPLTNTEIFGPGVCGTPTPSPTPTPATPTPTPTVTATASATATPIPTLTPTPSPMPPAQPLNLSTRMLVQTDANVGIGGFIITGTNPKQVILRGIGPSLVGAGVPNPLADPIMELHGPAGTTTVTNDNWKDTQQAAIQATGLAPTNDLESAILVTISPGAYTTIVRGKNNTTGVGVVEVYDVVPGVASKLANISTRAFVSTGNDVVIAGFILGGGNNTSNVVIRGIGPSLADSGISDTLADPTLELRDSNGTILSSNDNCAGSALPPTNPLEACIDISLNAGAYTAILVGKNGGTGIGLVEIYCLN